MQMRRLDLRGREVTARVSIADPAWLYNLRDDDFVAISQRSERGEGLADRVPTQGRWDAAGAIFRCIVVCDTG